MDYNRIRIIARRIVCRHPSPDFYNDYLHANILSARLFDYDPVLRRLKTEVTPMLQNNLGHGMLHSVKVALDAGALTIIEFIGRDVNDPRLRRRVMVAQCAGLLHDIERKQKDHAVKGAVKAADILKAYPLSLSEIEDVRLAVINHEAFKNPIKVDSSEGLMLSDCLYDADKFRWGPDNFTDTIWDMMLASAMPLARFMALYPSGLEHLEKVKYTFRTKTGREYGPRFIDLGLAIGQELYHVIQAELKDQWPFTIGVDKGE